MDLQELFHLKTTENGDLCFNQASDDNLINLLFMTEYFQKHLNEVALGSSDRDKLFAQFIRDPRYGLGRRDLGRKLMLLAHLTPEQVVKAGRFDDLFGVCPQDITFNYFAKEIRKGNELAKKWAPRYSSKNLLVAREFAKWLGMNKQQYGHFIKADTTEQKLSRKNTESINFEHVPSLALLKYYKRFANGEDTKNRFAQYLQDVKAGKKELHVSTTTVYDIFKNRDKIDPDLFFEKLEKVKGNWIPIVDTSGSMVNRNDSMGKALAIGHYLAKCSTYAPDRVITFSSHPSLIQLGEPRSEATYFGTSRRTGYVPSFMPTSESQYINEINSMNTGDCSNTDLGAVMNLLSNLTDTPEYLIVLSDMEFDEGSHTSLDKTMALFAERGITTKIIWWNLNATNTTAPQMDSHGNIFMSGYSPYLLKFLQTGFDAKAFLNALLEEYKKNLEA